MAPHSRARYPWGAPPSSVQLSPGAMRRPPRGRSSPWETAQYRPSVAGLPPPECHQHRLKWTANSPQSPIPMVVLCMPYGPDCFVLWKQGHLHIIRGFVFYQILVSLVRFVLLVARLCKHDEVWGGRITTSLAFYSLFTHSIYAVNSTYTRHSTRIRFPVLNIHVVYSLYSTNTY